MTYTENEKYAERLAASVLHEIRWLMEKDGVTQKELAERLGCTPGNVSLMLSGPSSSWTLRTITRVYTALGYVPTIGREELSSR